ncbi:MAG: hypothetical protein IJW31_00680 [Lentisphaeria bacterium]|nr:hypothetical protein [Lentisphaeria bacterium]
MVNYRKITLRINSADGQLIDEFYERIIREESLPRLLVADTVLAEFHFLEENNDGDWVPKVFPEGTTYRIIGDIDDDNATDVILQAESNAQYSDLSQGVMSFIINSNTQKFADALNGRKSIKGTFVIYGINSDNLSEYFVLAKNFFLAENRPYDIDNIPDEDCLKTLTREELQLLLADKVTKLELTEVQQKNNAEIESLKTTLGTLAIELDNITTEVM